ncbi:MAG: DNRLRE domain-containing protein [Planctomycetes bacterium]|nr:DNRLRE domain-containing protein [Planctomycetota bacterium]
MSRPTCFVFALYALALPASAQLTTVAISASQDATIYWQAPGTADGGGQWLHSRFDDLADVETHDFLLRFDVASQIPAGASVQSARIELVCVEVFSTAAFPLVAQRVTQPWTEGSSDAAGNEWTGVAAQAGDVTASHASFPATPWTPPIVTPGVVTGAAIQPPGVWILPSTPNAIAAAQAWLDQPAANFGLYLSTQETVRFASRENGALPGPRLVVEYLPPCGQVQNECVATPNSTGHGATLGWSGSTSLAQNAFTVTLAGGVPNSIGFFFFGTLAQQTPWGNGQLCVDGQLFRLLPAVPFSASGAAQRPLNFATVPANQITPFSTWRFQCKYRDVAAGGALFNSTDALRATFCP